MYHKQKALSFNFPSKVHGCHSVWGFFSRWFFDIPYLVSLHFVIYRLSDTSLMGCWFLTAFSKTYLMMMVHYDWSEIWSQILHIKLHYWVSLWLRVATPIDQTVQNSGEHHYPPILLKKRLCRMLYTPWLKLTLPLASSAIIANFANSYATLEL